MDMSGAGAIGLSMLVGAVVGGAAAKATGHDRSMGEAAGVAVPVGIAGGALFQAVGELRALKPGSFELEFWGSKASPVMRHAAVGAFVGALAGAAAARLVSGDF